MGSEYFLAKQTDGQQTELLILPLTHMHRVNRQYTMYMHGTCIGGKRITTTGVDDPLPSRNGR